MIVGSNERMHMWQDEGFNTFINTFCEARRYPEKGDQMSARAARARADRGDADARTSTCPIDIAAGPHRPGNSSASPRT